MGYSFYIMSDFENGLISRTFGAFSGGFFDGTFLNDL